MKTKDNILTYFLTRSLFLGGGISTLFLHSSKDAYLAIILGTILGIGIIYLICYLKKDINNTLNEHLKKKTILNILIKLLLFLYIIYGIFLLLVILSTFLYSYFLPFTPSFISCLPFIFLASYLSTKNIKKIVYIAQVLFVISLILIFLKTILLTNNFEFSNLLPLFTIKPLSLFKTSFIFSILSTAPFILLIDENITFKESAKYYLIGSLTIFIVVLTLTIVLGDLINIYSYPEYSVLRKISLFNFIENIENFISIGWFFDIFICLSLSTLKIKNLLNTKKRIIPFLLVLVIMFFVSKIIINDFSNSMIIYKTFPFTIAIFLFLIIILLFIKKITKHS